MMETSFKRSHAGIVALSAPNPAAGHHQPMPPPETSSGHSRTQRAYCLWSLLEVVQFQVLSLYFKFIFVHGMRVAQFYQHHLLKRLSFLHCIFLPMS